MKNQLVRRGRTAAAAGALAAIAALSTVSAAAAPTAAPAHQAAQATATTYANPVSRPFADTFADPSVIRGKDGWWYAYGTSDPLREGERTPHRIPMARSSDLAHWTYVGDAFSDANLPSWLDRARNAAIWAPDIRYVDGAYRMYYVVTDTTVTPEPNDNAVGVATAPTPTGPWTDSGAPVVGPRRGGAGEPGNFLWTFDPSAVTDTDGSQWLFYGSYYGGVHVSKLDADGKRAVPGTERMVAIDNKFEGAYVVRRNGYWYLFASTANCCAGPTTGYSVQVGRSRDLRGPYVDRQGVPLNQSRAGGTPTLTQNGNRWIGAGHNAVATDLAGQDWIVYHALDRADPFLDEPYGINERPMLLDRLDWVGGWPAVRAGQGPSQGRQRGPVGAAPRAVTTGGLTRAWRTAGRWTAATDAQTGGYLRSRSAGSVLTRSARRGDTRVEADLRSVQGAAYGLRTAVAGNRRTSVVIDPARGTVTLRQSRPGAFGKSTRAHLPSGFDATAWHSVSLERRGRTVTAEVTWARLGDPLGVVRLRLGAGTPAAGRSGAVAAGRGVGVANLSAVPVARRVTRLLPEHVPSRLDRAASDEFTGGTLGAGWTWVRKDDAATVSGGALRWPVQSADLTGPDFTPGPNPGDPPVPGNQAGVLLRDIGTGPWTAETKLSIDLGTDTIRNFQQGGLIAYVDDDLFTRLSHVAIWNTRQIEFGKEMTFASDTDPNRLSYGGTIIGPPADTTWLRITHRTNAAGEHVLRGWSSTDGRTWVKGGAWTLPAGSDLRIGLVSHGNQSGDPRATSVFDYLRVYRD